MACMSFPKFATGKVQKQRLESRPLMREGARGQTLGLGESIELGNFEARRRGKPVRVIFAPNWTLRAERSRKCRRGRRGCETDFILEWQTRDQLVQRA